MAVAAGDPLRRGAQRLSASSEPAAPDPRTGAPDRTRTVKRLRLEDDDAFEMLESILELRRKVEQDGKAGRHRATIAAKYCDALIRGIMGWAAELLGFLRPPAVDAQLPLEDRRRLAAVTIALGLPVFNFKDRMEIADGLLAKNWGQEDPFLRTTKTGRRGAAPGTAARAKLDLLKWIRWQHGIGRKVADAETDVAQAVGCTREAIQKWHAELPKVFGEAFVRDQLALAERIGALEGPADGRADHRPGDSERELGLMLWTTLVNHRPFDSDLGHVLCMASANLDRDLSKIAERRRAAVAKRRVAKSEDK
jgi:hypothetical protein